MLLIIIAQIVVLTNALPHSPILDWGSIDDEIIEITIIPPSNTLSLAPENTTPSAFVATQTEHATTHNVTTEQTEPTLTITSTTGNASVPALPFPTLLTLHSTVPTNDACNDNTIFISTSTEIPLPNPPITRTWPSWTTPATFVLIFYDLLTLAALLWLWICGYLTWFRYRQSGSITAENAAGEMMDLRLRRGEMWGNARTWEWSAGVGIRESESQARRRGEIEGEMRRLGMI